MKGVLAPALAALASLSVVAAADIMGSVVWNTAVPDISRLSNNAKVSIGPSADDKAFIRHDGTFVIQNVRPGSYVLEVQSIQYNFNKFRVDVLDNPSLPPVVTGYDHRYSRAAPASSESPLAQGEQPLAYPIQLVPQGKIMYEIKQEGFKPLKMLMANPLYLLMGGMVIFMMIMPKLIGMLDPEALEEMNRNQAAMHKSMGDFQNMDFAKGFSRMINEGGPPPKEDAPVEKPVKPQGASTGVRQGGGGKRRKG